MPVDIVAVQPGAADAFVREREREALKTLYNFSVVWHEQRHAFEARSGDEVSGIAEIRIAASLAHVVRVLVDSRSRREGIGRALLGACSDTANYYNCHKMTVTVPHKSAAQAFFEACGYKVEAVLPQHEFKLDSAVLRKFLL